MARTPSKRDAAINGIKEQIVEKIAQRRALEMKIVALDGEIAGLESARNQVERHVPERTKEK